MTQRLSSSFTARVAIDLIEGQVVRLRQGDYADKTVYASNPVEMAQQLADAGLTHLHLVDLDGAKAGAPKQVFILEAIAQAVDLQLDWSGGLKTAAHVKHCLDAGAAQVAIGSLAVKQPDVFEKILRNWGAERVILAADVKDEQVMVSGWQEGSGLQLFPFLEKYVNKGVRNLLCTDVQQDGMLSGPSVDLYRKIQHRFPDLNVIASGGVRNLADLLHLESEGITDAIIGKAIYEKQLSLGELAERN